MGTFHVQVTKDYLVFCAAHFVTYGAGQCEGLHGHNYRLSVRLYGTLTEHELIFDFVILKERLRDLVNQLDHYTLLPTKNPWIAIGEEGENVTVRYKKRFYSFPRRDVRLLPISNTTAEMLAQWFAEGVREFLDKERATNITAIEIKVDESFGQSATYREDVRWT